jgi:glycine cleavage system H lipoate-binding protein/ABC-type phosphate transport system substrate-binding protein
MKKTFFLIVSVLLLYAVKVVAYNPTEKDNTKRENTISILCSPDLYDLTIQWGHDYSKINPGLTFDVVPASPEEFSGMLKKGPNLGFVSNRYYQSFENNLDWKILVGRDIVVPVINSNNPFIDQIDQKGISSAMLAEILKNPHARGWELFLDNGKHISLNYYHTDDASILSEVADFTNTHQTKIKGTNVKDGKALVDAIQNDIYGLGFCKLNDIIGHNSHELADNIKLLPIDINGNGQIDYFEQIYDNLNAFTRGVWIGKYPKTFVRNLYSVANSIPNNETEAAFLKWVLTDGQQVLETNGYCELVSSERLSKLEMLSQPEIYQEATNESYAIQKILLLLCILFVGGGIFANTLIRIKRKRKNYKTLHSEAPDHLKVINENSLSFPNGLYFDKTFTWAFMEKDGRVKVGIDDFLQHVTGKYTRVKLKKTGEKIKKNEQMLSLLQNGKQLNIYSPVSGTVTSVNETLANDPSIINTSPYTEGWFYSIEPSNWLREIQFLKMAGKHKEWLRGEFSRLKDFLASSLYTKTPEFSPVALQDGGELKDNVLQDLGPEVWEDFQKNFIDKSGLK